MMSKLRLKIFSHAISVVAQILEAILTDICILVHAW